MFDVDFLLNSAQIYEISGSNEAQAHCEPSSRMYVYVNEPWAAV